MKKKAVLYLKDGSLYEGRSFGWAGENSGEVVFNTSMTGYEEIITDPSYRGQIIVMCYPHIGNYGINHADSESYGVWPAGFAVRECSETYSSYLARAGLDGYLRENRVPGIESIDTRALVRKIRDSGSMPGIISAVDFDPRSLKEKLDRLVPFENRDLVAEVNASENAAFRKYRFTGGKGKVIAVVDYGAKLNIVRQLENKGFSVKILPGSSDIKNILSEEPDCVLLSNGPGDPVSASGGLSLARDLIELNRAGRRLPLLGICLGHQLIGLGAGGRTFKLKFGHHGGNHPVKDLRNQRVSITAQNHNYCVDPAALPDDFEVTHINLNDGTVEGFRHKTLPVIGCQYHPEGGPGPNDAGHLFGEFLEMLNA